VGRGAVGCCGARGSFYRAEEREWRRCGEGNGRRRRCALKAFNPLILGGERRGEWGVRGRGCGTVSKRGGVIGVAGAHGGGGGGGARSGFRRKKTVGLTDRVGPLSVRGRRRAG
jgi:hypothetical protein